MGFEMSDCGIADSDCRLQIRVRARLEARDDVVAEQGPEAGEDHAGRALNLDPPLRGGRFDDQHAALELHRRHALERRTDGRAPGELHLPVRERRRTQQLHQRTWKGMSEGTHIIYYALDPRVRVASPR